STTLFRSGVGGRRRDDTAHRCPRAGRDAADDRDQGIQVRTAHSQRPRGLDGDVGQSRRGAAHGHVSDGRLQFFRARQRRHVRADLHEIRHLPVLLQDSSLHEGHFGREVDATNGEEDGMDRLNRRGFLECMAWAGTGVVWTAAGGLLSSRLITEASAADAAVGSFTFVQISDTHIGFKGEANKDAAATLQQVVDRVNGLRPAPAFVLHTGDQTHGQKAGAFDTVAEILKGVKTERIFYVPGEHDVFLDSGKEYLARYGTGTVDGRGWQSFDYKGTHFVGLVNVLKYKGEGMGALGEDQIAWLEKDLAPLSTSTPVVIFAHVPLWAVYPQWGWTTEDATRALTSVKRFGSVTVLNGHIHQVMTKVEGNVRFHTAMSTAFPQPAPGAAPSPGPMKIPETDARRMIGVTEVTLVRRAEPLAIVDSTLG